MIVRRARGLLPLVEPAAALRRNFSASPRAAATAAPPPEGPGKGRSRSDKGDDGPDDGPTGRLRGILNSTAAEAALGASAGVILLGLAGMYYHSWYKKQILVKMEKAFDPGYDPVLALAQSSAGAKEGQLAYVHVEDRAEDQLLRKIMRGEERGRYFLVLGPKGSGKTTSLIQAMQSIQADGVAFFEAHPDPSIVVDRFSESINYAMYRDFLGNLVGLNDMSGMSTFQMLERALHKLEAALIRRRQRTGKPAVIVMNSAHLVGHEDEGKRLLTVLQQRAEKWASAGTATFIFTSNDYFVYDLLRRNSNRMDTLTFKDLSQKQSIEVLRSCREQYWSEDPASHREADLDAVYRISGGRLSLLNKLARRKNMLRAAHQLVEDDLQFLLSKTGIIEDHDDDVMDEQKWSTCSWLLFVELAKRQKALEEEIASRASSIASSSVPSVSTDLPSATDDADEAGPPRVTESALTDPTQDLEADVPVPNDVPNPSLTWGEVRQVMTRPDFVQQLDHLNLIHIDKHHHIRADSMPLLRAFQKVLEEEEDFEGKLERVMDRVSAIESLLRTKELVWKEQGPAGKSIVRRDAKGREMESWFFLGGDERLGREEEGGEVAGA